MKFRRKSLKRLGIILLVVVALSATAGYLTWREHAARNAQIEADRKVGWLAYVNKDYGKALEHLAPVYRAYPDDTKIALAYAESRFRTETSSDVHLKDAVETLDHILKREPDNLAAKHLLLEIYPLTANTEWLERLSDNVLAENPDDTRALLGRITVRLRQSRLEEALEATKRFADLKPDDLSSRIRAMQLMRSLQKPPADMQAFADAQFPGNPMDPRRLLLQARAANYHNDHAKTDWYLQQAASQPLTDPDFVRHLTSLFDQLQRYKDSQALLEAVATRTGDPEIIRVLIQRLWQNGRNAEIIERLASIDENSPKADAELLAMRAMAHYQNRQADKARHILAILKARKDSRKAAAWATALEARFEDFAQPPAAIATKLAGALARDPENGIFLTWLAENYHNLGEYALALRHWHRASLMLPSWSKPFDGMSQAFLELGQPVDADDAASSAVERFGSTSAILNRIRIRHRLVQESNDTRGAKDLLTKVEQIQQKYPGEPQTLSIYVSLLAMCGQREATVQQMQKVIQAPGKYDDATLMRLASISRNDGFGLEDELLQANGDRATSAPLALMRAMRLGDAGNVEAGLQLIEKAAGNARNDIAWASVIAQYLDAVNDPRADGIWRKLGEENPKSLAVQREILSRARGIRKDREFISKTINRLRDLTGQDGQQWRLERARFLVESPEIMKDGVEAALLLREIIVNAPRQIEPRLLLAKAQELTGNTTDAIEHLRVAQSVDPRSATVALELIRLLQQRGRSDDVREVLKTLSATAMMNARQRVMLASLMADAGDAQRAVNLLTPDESRGVLLAPGRVLLAELYRRVGDNANASKIYDTLLAGATPSASAIASAAEFYATQGDLSRARETLARLNSATSAQPADIAIACGRFEERFGTPEAALKHFRRAAETGTEAGMLALVDYHLRNRDFAQAASDAQAAQQRHPNSTTIANRALETQALAAQKDDDKNLQPLIDALSRDPSRAAEVEALKALQDIRSGKVAKAEITARLRTVADRFPRFLPVQEQVIENYLEIRKTDEAVVVARRTMEALPTDPAAARLAVRALRAARLWNEMRVAAEKWKSRSSTGTLEADTAIAEALLETNKPAEALAQLEPHRSTIQADVRAQPQAAVVMARAMLAQENGSGARDLLTPLLKDVGGRRMWVMISVGAAKTLNESVRWIESVAAATPSENLDERLAIATAWTQIARKYDDRATLERAAEKLADYLTTRPRDGEALLMMGTAYLHLGKHAAAETAIRAILDSKPDHPAAANDLACLLVAENRSLDEAEKLARVAIGKAPTSAVFQDTLARVLLARQQIDASKATFETALRLDPDLVDARVGYARVLHEKGDAAGAARELKRVDTQLQTNPQAARRLQTELTALRAQLTRND